MYRILLSMIAAAAIAAPAAAHHETPGKSHAVATVTITEQVKAGGQPLAPGTYEVWILDDRPDLQAGAPSNAQRVVELHQSGKMVAREVAEVFGSAERPVGTSGATRSGMGKASVQRLRGGEFLRISINDGGAASCCVRLGSISRLQRPTSTRRLCLVRRLENTSRGSPKPRRVRSTRATASASCSPPTRWSWSIRRFSGSRSMMRTRRGCCRC